MSKEPVNRRLVGRCEELRADVRTTLADRQLPAFSRLRLALAEFWLSLALAWLRAVPPAELGVGE